MADSFKIRLGSIFVQSSEGLSLHPGIVAVAKAKRMPVKAQYHLGTKILKRLRQELTDLDEKRQELVKEFGEEVVGEDEKPSGQWRVIPDKFVDFMKAYQELLDTEVTIEFRTLKVSELGEPEGTTPEDLMACSAFIEE